MRAHNIKYIFLPNKMLYNMLCVSYYIIHKQRKDIKLHPEYDGDPVPYVTSISLELYMQHSSILIVLQKMSNN